MNAVTSEDQKSNHSKWKVFGDICPKQGVVFFAQIIIIYIVIIACIVNLSLKIGESNMWVALLSSCLGYLLPSPTIAKHERPFLRHAAQQ